MSSINFLVLIIIVTIYTTKGARTTYAPNWESLDKRPLPSWYDQSKFGIFIHWGLFSVPSYGPKGVAWFWDEWQGMKNKDYVEFMKNNYKPSFTYADFAPEFTAELYNPNAWADMFKASGAKYVVLVSKHHEGFTNWPSKYSWNWNSMDVGPKRDLVGELATAIRSRTDIHFGLYHSLYEWFNPLYKQDKANGYKTQEFVERKTMPELYELVNAYKPEVVWSDGDWEASDTYWNSTGFLAWLYNESPVRDTVVTNDRWGAGVKCKHGGYYTCHDKYNPKTLQKHKWENCMTIDRTAWGYRRTSSLADFLDVHELITTLAETVSCGGNLLMNVGPTKDGTIIPIYEERLRQMGSWLRVNGNAIYSTMPWQHQNDTLAPNVWFTSRKSNGKTTVYAIVLEWPSGEFFTLDSVNPTPTSTVKLMGYSGGNIYWKKSATGSLDIQVPVIPINKMPCLWAWVFQLDSVLPA